MKIFFTISILSTIFLNVISSSTEILNCDEIAYSQKQGLTLFIYTPLLKGYKTLHEDLKFFIIFDLRNEALKQALKFSFIPSTSERGIALASSNNRGEFKTQTTMEINTSFVYFVLLENIEKKNKQTLQHLISDSLIKRENQAEISDTIYNAISSAETNNENSIQQLKKYEVITNEFNHPRETSYYPSFSVLMKHAFDFKKNINSDSFDGVIHLNIAYEAHYKSGRCIAKDVHIQKILLNSPGNKHWARINVSPRHINDASHKELLDTLKQISQLKEIDDVIKTEGKKEIESKPKELIEKKREAKMSQKSEIFMEKQLKEDNVSFTTPENKDNKLSSFGNGRYSVNGDEIGSFHDFFEHIIHRPKPIRINILDRKSQSQCTQYSTNK
eukprot:GAHX01001592.1.p1 GENE.GAHX01001592.1~~GAHX01001592.1.p1  ORF type:complete len:387 (-),score=68.43 GAHX01001592.1:146-1306(-)